MTLIERKTLHKFMMLERRERQLSRQPSSDAWSRYFSRNSSPAYRKA